MLKSFWFASFFLFINLTSHAEQIKVDPCQMVCGVNVVTGKLNKIEIDETTKGLEPLQLIRSYCKSEHDLSRFHVASAPNLGGWYLNFNYLLFSDCKNKKDIYLSDCKKGYVKYSLDPSNNKFYLFDLSGNNVSTNVDSGVLSGKSYPNNLKIGFLQEGFLGAFSGEGILSYFAKIDGISPPLSPFLLLETYFLKNLKSSTGRVVSNVYDEKGRLKEIRSTTAKGITLAYLKFNWNEKGATVKTSDDKTFEYRYDSLRSTGLPVRSVLSTVQFPDGHVEKYNYTTLNQKDFISSKEMPGGRKEVIEYKDKKVSKILKTINDGKLLPVATFQYKNGLTEVLDVLGNLTRYFYNEKGQVTSVEKYKNNEKHEVKRYYYNGINLQALSQENGKGETYLFRSFEYDSRGNVIIEKLFGNLTGKKKNPISFVTSLKPNEKTTDCYIKQFSYSDDGYNLLLSEFDGIKKINYSYHPHTHQLLAQFTSDSKGIKLREFREYDPNGEIQKIITDNGTGANVNDLTGCTERKITVQTPNKKNFLPEIIEQKYLDFTKGIEVLLQKTVNYYSNHNDIVKQEVYGSDGTLAYSTKKEFDAMGRCMSETDPEENSIKYVYDVFGNKIEKIGPRQGEKSRYAYDFSNHLISSNENGRESQFRYDLLGNKASEKIPTKGEILYGYDVLGKLIEIVLQDGSRIKKKYDLLGHVVEEINERGDILLTEVTLRGQPTKKTLISNGKEIWNENFRYDVKGNLIEQIARNGLKTLYTYDFLDRKIKTEQLSPEGEILSVEEAFYNGSHLSKTKDIEGNETNYAYDAAGREIEVRGLLYQTTKEYDSLGRLICVKEWSGDKKEDYRATRYQYDRCGRILNECKEDGKGHSLCNVSYAYDEAGNLILKKQGKVLGNKIQYDFFNRPVKETDALSNELKISYEESPGRLKKRVTYPSGVFVDTILNARGWIESITKRNKGGTVLRNHVYFYDKEGNNIEEHMESLSSKGILQRRKNIQQFSHNHLLVSSVLNADTPQALKSVFSYDVEGNLIQKQEGSSQIKYSYDFLGRLLKITTVSQLKDQLPVETSYTYSRNNLLLSSISRSGDKNTVTTRKYDVDGNLVSEKQGNGHVVNYRCDKLGRKVALILPDSSEIHREYEGAYLKKIRRIDPKGAETYSYEVLNRDFRGLVTEAKLIGTAGIIKTSYDNAGRIIAIEAPHYSSKVKYDAAGRVEEEIIKDYFGEIKNNYSYDSISELISEKGEFNHSYSYDGFFNRLSKDDTLYKFDSNQQVTNDKDFNYHWENNGNLKKRNEESFNYDALSRLISYKFKKDTHEYTYDSFDRLIKKDNKSYLYDGEKEIAYLDAKGKLRGLRVFACDENEQPDLLIAIEFKGKLMVPIQDHYGNVVALLDPKKGKVMNALRYGAFGEERTSEKKPLSPWRFRGQRYNKESGLISFGHLYYDPELGKFINAPMKKLEF